ncbi:SapC family protein [Terriglobus roseus]|uniref:SapC protein n=1 Tax=Terriglobus roseus TaxID=392734 RepID=A0A1G7GPW3_9BACT|nr:SapC family protein [Terriglobus roseus]SDE90146.1 SapC protein [Terriglobus roseus]
MSDIEANHNVPEPSPNLPMFYRKPRPMDRARDKDLKIARTTFRFAEKTNAIPIVIDEFPMASAYYPIVFAAVVGLVNDSNLFVDGEGQWVDRAYLPGYVRRYPFILMDDPAHKQFVLCIDEESDMLGTERGDALFDGDELSDVTSSMMEFCAALRQQGDATNEFVSALMEFGMLTEMSGAIELPGGNLQLGGLLIIDSKKFDQLPNKTFLKWREKGWIGLIYAQLFSLHRWQNLGAMTAPEVRREAGGTATG